MGFPFNISATAEASDFKFGMHHKITPREKRGADFGLGELSKILGSPFNISAKAEASEFKFGMQLGFAKAHHKITHRGKVAMG